MMLFVDASGDCQLTMIEAFATSQDLFITVNFTSDDPSVPFECRINDEEFISCKYTS